MEINEFLKLNISKLISIINNLDDEFSSHIFIEKFAKQYEKEYIEFLYKYKGKGAFQKVHSQIAKFLSDNSSLLGIIKNKKLLSKNIFGDNDEIQSWKKI